MRLTTLASIQPPCFREKGSDINDRILDRGFEYLEFALTRGASYCCLPEVFNVFGAEDRDKRAAAANWETVLDRVLSLSKRHEAFVVVPLLMEEDGRFYNRIYMAGPTGTVLGHYDKIHITRCETEEYDLQAGKEISVLDLGDVRVGTAICYDLYFPEFFSALVELEPDVVFIPSLQRSDHEPANQARMQTRAMDTMAYLVRSSFGCPADEAWKPGMMFGQSCIVHPDGTILANAGHYEGVALASVKLPFTWKRARCGGGRPEPVREFIGEDRINGDYTTRVREA